MRQPPIPPIPSVSRSQKAPLSGERESYLWSLIPGVSFPVVQSSSQVCFLISFAMDTSALRLSSFRFRRLRYLLLPLPPKVVVMQVTSCLNQGFGLTIYHALDFIAENGWMNARTRTGAIKYIRIASRSIKTPCICHRNTYVRLAAHAKPIFEFVAPSQRT